MKKVDHDTLRVIQTPTKQIEVNDTHIEIKQRKPKKSVAALF